MKPYLILFVAIIGLVLQQPKPADKPAYTLTEQEQQQWTELAKREEQNKKALDLASADLINLPAGSQSVELHSHYQSAWLALNLAQSQRREWLARLKEEQKCLGCAIAQDGKALIRPKPEGEAKR